MTSESQLDYHTSPSALLPTRPLLDTHPLVAIPYLAIVGSAMVVGIIGNLLTIAAFFVSPRVRVLGNEFVFNLALVDLIVSVVSTPMLVVGVVSGEEFFALRPALCTAVACLCLGACINAFLTLTAITVHRYMYVCHPSLHRRAFTRPVFITIIILTWVVSFLLVSSNFFGWGGHRFDDKHMSCMWDRISSPSYTIYLATLLIGTPIVIMILAYLRIFHVFRLQRSRVRSEVNGKDYAKARKAMDWLETMRSTNTFFFVLLAFILMWGPYAIVVAIDTSDELSLETHLFVSAVAHSHAAFNAIIYLCTNPHFKAAYMKVVCLVDNSFEVNLTVLGNPARVAPVNESDIHPSLPAEDPLSEDTSHFL